MSFGDALTRPQPQERINEIVELLTSAISHNLILANTPSGIPLPIQVNENVLPEQLIALQKMIWENKWGHIFPAKIEIRTTLRRAAAAVGASGPRMIGSPHSGRMRPHARAAPSP